MLLLGFGADSIKTESSHWLIMGKTMSHTNAFRFYPIFVKLAVSNFCQIGPLSLEVRCPWTSKVFSHRLIMGKWCLQVSMFIFDRIFVKLAGNQDIKSLTSLNSGRIGSVTSELHALEHQKNSLYIYTFQTWIALRPVGQSWSKFICGISAALGFGADWIKTVVFISTKSSHCLIMGKMMSPPFLSHFWSDLCQTCKYPRQA